MFSHALSTHRADNDVDFYTAVDDRQREDPTIEEEDRAGSGMMGTLEFTSAAYYRYIGLNFGLLEDDRQRADYGPTQGIAGNGAYFRFRIQQGREPAALGMKGVPAWGIWRR